MKQKLSAIRAILSARAYILVTNKGQIVDVGGGPSDDHSEVMTLAEQVTGEARDMHGRLEDVIREVEQIHGIMNTNKVRKSPRKRATSKK